MSDASPFLTLSPTTLADVLGREHVLDFGIHPLWPEMPRIAGPAFTVRCAPGDNLMLHAAIHRAPSGSIIVVESGDTRFALAGGNVCAVAQKRGILGFVLDGLLRDVGEARAIGFPVFARGVIPIPGSKDAAAPLGEPVTCGGARVATGDVIVADAEGIVVVPSGRLESVVEAARARAAKDAAESLESWEASHRARIFDILRKKGIAD
jgi:regulator of RNase E activity RraA